MHQSFIQASEQDGDTLYNVLCFYFYVVSTMRGKCGGLIDLDNHCFAV